MTRASTRLGAVSVLALATLAAAPAYAQSQSSAGSTITNNVTMNYQVGGVAQTQQAASDAFTVDRKVNLTVAEVGTTTTQVGPGQTAAVTTFQVTNSSNATLDFALAIAQQTGGAGAHSNTDNFDATNLRIFVDTNGNGVYDAGTDTQVTYLDELAADTSRTVFVLADIPLGRATGDVAAVTLTATGLEGGSAGTQGVALTQTATANTAAMDTVFADGAGAADGSRDASFSAKDDYTVQAAALTLAKVSRIVSDPFNGTANPKLIPGATVEYCISVKNAAGSATATNIALADLLPTSLTYNSTFGILLNGTVTGSTCNADGTTGGSYASGTVSGTIASLPASDARTLVFRATIN